MLIEIKSEILSKIIKENLLDDEFTNKEEAVKLFISQISQYFKSQNSSFDENIFYKNCGLVQLKY